MRSGAGWAQDLPIASATAGWCFESYTLTRRHFRQVSGVSCFARSRFVFAGFGFSALRFIVAVITGLAFVVALDLDIGPDGCGSSSDEEEAMAGAPSGACSAILLDRIKTITRALNQGRPSRRP
jgi:hypothetical protein